MLAKQALSIELAKKVAAAAIAEAKRNDWAVAVAVVDDGGHLMYLERLDDTQKASSVIAAKKAKTAILFKRPSAAIEKAIAEKDLRFRAERQHVALTETWTARANQLDQALAKL